MSGVIDKNVIQMVFDAAGFQKSAQDTLSILDKFKEALNFEGAIKGLENLGTNVKDIGMDGLYTGINKVQDGFNALDVVATRVLQNITDKIQSVATNLIDKVTVEPLRAGLSEYETQINSVQTILANTNDALIEKGLTTEHDRIEKINSVLDELNHYADMTIYNFTEMTRNIGTFTAAGVELDTAATAIQGIANLAAMSGSNSQQASTAMYQLSQAIASGSVKLQDWNSVVNAGMGGKLFQNELIDTAKAMGVADDKFNQLTSGAITFRDSLQSGWISAEVLTNTLEKFTAGTEGYTHSQVESMQELWRARGYSETQIRELTGAVHELTDEEEKNVRQKWYDKGFTEEQVNHIMEMGTAATDAATKVKTFTQLLDTVAEALQSGWTQSWEYIIGDFEQAKMLWTEVSDIMNLYIGKSADARNTILAEWARAAYFYNEEGKLVRAVYNEAGELDKEASTQIVEDGKMIREEMGGRELVIQSLRNMFQGTLEVVLEFKDAWSTGFTRTGMDDDITITGQKLKDLSLALYDFSYNFKQAFKRDEQGNAIGLLNSLSECFRSFASSVRNAYEGVKSVFSGLGNILESFFQSSFFSLDSLISFTKAIQQISGVIRQFGDNFNKHFGNIDGNREGLITFFSALSRIIDANVWTKLNIITSGFDMLLKIFNKLIEPFGTVSKLLGIIGDRIDIFTQAFNSMMHDDSGLSEIVLLFNDLTESITSFIDIIRNSVDFSGFKQIFDTIIEFMLNKPNEVFDPFSKTLDSIVNIIKAFVGVASPVIGAFSTFVADMLPPAIEFINELATRVHDFTAALVPNEELMRAIQHVADGLFNVLGAIGEVVGTVLLSVWDSFGKILKNFLPSSEELTDILQKLGDKLGKFAEIVRSLVGEHDGVPKLSEIIGKITDKFISFFKALKDINLLEKLANLFKRIGDGIKHALGGTDDMTLLDVVLDKISHYLTRLKEILSDENGNLDFVKIFEAGGIGVVIKKLVDFFKKLKDETSNLSAVFSFIKDFKEILSDISESFSQKFKAESIKAIATAMLEIAAAMFVLAMIDATSLSTAVLAMASMFQMINNVLFELSKLDKGEIAAGAGAIAALGTAMLELTGSIAVLGNMDFPALLQGLGAVIILMGAMVEVVKQLSKISNDLPKVTGALLGLSFALLLLCAPIKILGSMDFSSLIQGLGAVALMMGGLVVALEHLAELDKGAKLMSAAASMVLMAFAIKLIGSSVESLAGVPWPDLAKGLIVFAAALAGMIGAAKVVAEGGKGGTSLADELATVAASMLMLGAAMEILAVAAKTLNDVQWESLGKMGAIFVVALVGLAAASKLIDGKNLLMIGGAIFLVATAITELAVTLELARLLGPICDSIALGIAGIRDSIEGFANHAAIEAFLQLIKDLILFIPQLAVALAQGIIEMVVVLGEGAAQLIEAVVQIGSAILGGVIELLPQIMEVILLFFAELWVVVEAEIPKAFEVLGIFFTELWTFLTEQTPQLFTWLTTLFTELLKMIQTLFPELSKTIFTCAGALLKDLLDFLNTNLPLIAQTLLTLLRTILQVINEAIPEIVGTLLGLLANLLQQLAEYVPQMAEAALQILLGFLQAIADNIGSITEAAITIALEFMRGITEKMPEIVDTAFKMIIGFIEGLAKAIEENHNELFDAIGHLIVAIVEALLDGIGKLADAAGKWFTGEDGNGGILGAIGSFFQNIWDAGANLVQGFIDGLTSMPGAIWDAACSLAEDAWNAITGTLDEHSPSKLTYGGGMNFTLGFINGIVDYKDGAIMASGEMARGVVDAFDSVVNNADSSYTPNIAPVLDMDASKYGYGDLFGDMRNTITGTTNISGTIAATKDLKNQMAQMIAAGNDYSAILMGMSKLSKDITTLGEQMAQMRIVMDSGALVGSLASDIDDTLGFRSIVTGRGVV